MPQTAKSYKAMRGRGGFVRSNWEEVSEIIAAANVHTIKTFGPDRVVGFSPIPAMSMVSYASGARYLSLIGGTLLSFYDWYCDLPPSSPQTWGEQTDVPESADWYNSAYIIAWGSNVPQTRTPDAHFFVEARYNGTKVVAITPDYSEVAKLSDLWLHPKQGTDAALAMAMGHVDPARVLPRSLRFPISRTTAAATPTCRCWCGSDATVSAGCRTAMCGKATCPARRARAAPPGRPSRPREETGELVVPQGSIGYRWPAEGEAKGRWNLEAKDGETSEDMRLALSVNERRDEVLPVAFPYFGGQAARAFPGKRPGRRRALAQRAGAPGRRLPTARLSSPPSSIFSAPITGSIAASAAPARRASTITCPIRRPGRNADHRRSGREGDRRRAGLCGERRKDARAARW